MLYFMFDLLVFGLFSVMSIFTWGKFGRDGGWRDHFITAFVNSEVPYFVGQTVYRGKCC